MYVRIPVLSFRFAQLFGTTMRTSNDGIPKQESLQSFSEPEGRKYKAVRLKRTKRKQRRGGGA